MGSIAIRKLQGKNDWILSAGDGNHSPKSTGQCIFAGNSVYLVQQQFNRAVCHSMQMVSTVIRRFFFSGIGAGEY